MTTFPEQKPKSGAGTGATAGEAGEGPEEGEADQDFSRNRNEWFIHQRAYPFAHIPAGARTRALQQHLALKAAGGRAKPALSNGAKPAVGLGPEDSFSGLNWNFDGPAYISFGAGQPPYSGRATSLAINPTNPLIMYLGTAAGGVWETADGGNSWAAITDSQASLAIGAIAIDPSNPNNIYVGTGEADYSFDSYYGQGLLKSTDGGNTWTLISTPFANGGSAPPFAQIAIEPGNSSVVLAATESGVYRSADAGATWTNELTSEASAVIFDPSNANTAYAGLNGALSANVNSGLTSAIYKSVDGGMTWTALTGGVGSPLPAWNTVYRTALTLDSGGNLLAGLAPVTFGTGTLYKSPDGGNTWAALTAPGDGLDYYRDWIVSVPGSPSTLYTGGVEIHQSLDGGVTWNTFSSPLWADTHAAVFSPDGTKMYVMDDGGVYVTTTSPAASSPTIISLNNSIGSMTFYPGFGIENGTPSATIVGSQDHGTQIGTAGAPWSFTGGGFVCGDGGPVVLDSAGVVAYAHCQGSGLAYWMSSATGGVAVQGASYPYGWVAAQTGITTSDRASWVPPIATDPSNVSVLYTGTYRVYQSTNGAQSWTLISGDLTQDMNPYQLGPSLNTIAVAPTDENTVYAGADDGTLSVTTNALSGVSATWTTLTGLPARSISKILVAPDSAQDVYVAVSGFGTGHIFHSTNGGATWTDLSGNLPDTPMDSIALDPTLANTIYLASDTGVYVTSNGGTSWEVLGTNLPNVVVQDIMVVASTRLLRVVTHGRGAWDLTLPLGSVVTPTVTVTPALSIVSTAQDLSVGITVAGGNGNPTPTGSVTLTGGGYTAAATTLSGGIATIDIPAGSLATGSDTLTVTYTPDAGSTSTYNSATGTAPVTVGTPTPIVPYLDVNGGAWQNVASVTVAYGSTVNLGPQPGTGGTWSWTGPNGFTSSLREIDGIISIAASNVYTATYTNPSGVQSTLVFTITVAATPIVPYIEVNYGAWQGTNNVAVAPGSTVNLGPQAAGSGTWSWSGPGFTSSAQQVNNIPLTSASNIYTATFTNAAGVTNTETFTITIAPTSITPYIEVNGGVWQATNNIAVAPGSNVNLGPQAAGSGTWSWSGPGFTSSAQQVNNVPLNSASNVYTASFTNAGGVTSSEVFTITIAPTTITPYVEVNNGAWQGTNNITVAAGSSVNLGPQAAGSGTWSWSGPGFASSAQQVNNVPLNSPSNVYTASFTNAAGVISTETFTITVAPTTITPYVEVNNGAWQGTNNITVAAGSSVNLGPQAAGGGTWSWSGPGFTSSAQQVNNVPLTSASNVYTATFTNAAGAISTETFTITVAATPIVPYIEVNYGAWQGTNSVTVNPGSIVNLGPQAAGSGTWSWSGPSYTASTQQVNNVPLTSASNIYTATYTNVDGVTSMEVFTITVNATPITPYIQDYGEDGGAWQAVSSITANAGNWVNLGPQAGSGGTWSWSGPNGYHSAAQEIDGVPLTLPTNTYIATYTNPDGVTSTQTFTITIAPTAITPYIEVNSGAWQETNSLTVASGSTVNLGPQPGNGGSWSWSGPGGFLSGAREIDGIPLSDGTNTYVATYTNPAGVTSMETFTITVD
jgi:hypothetical protein